MSIQDRLAADREAARQIARDGFEGGATPPVEIVGEGEGGQRYRVSIESAGGQRPKAGLETSARALLEEGVSVGDGKLRRATFEELVEGCDLVRRALATATRAHEGATRKHGTPYIDHPRRVARALWELEASRGLDVELVAAALLHDVVEDSPVSVAALREEFGERVARLVGAVTKQKGVLKEQYLATLPRAEPQAIALKIADRADNLRDLVLQDDQQFARRYLEETSRWLVPLAQKVSAGLRESFEEALAAAERRFASGSAPA